MSEIADNNTNKQKASKNIWLIMGIVFFVLLAVSLLARLYLANKAVNQQERVQQLTQLGFYTFATPRQLSSIRLQSVNHGNATGDFLDYGEGWRIVNFGYLSCPDICPINLSLLSNMKKTWDNNNVKPAFDVVHVTFDPERDQPETLKDYLSYMHSDFYGLTGKLTNIQQLAKELNVLFIYEKPDADGNYFITHSDSMALVNPRGEYVGLFKGPYQMEDMIAALKIVMGVDS